MRASSLKKESKNLGYEGNKGDDSGVRQKVRESIEANNMEQIWKCKRNRFTKKRKNQGYEINKDNDSEGEKGRNGIEENNMERIRQCKRKRRDEDKS